MQKISQNNKDLLLELVKTDFKLRYNNSALGFIWVLLKPFLLFAILYFVFSYLFKTEKNYGLSLLLGILMFSYFSEGTSRGLTTLLDKSNIILKVNFARQIAVFVPAINALINFLIGTIIFFIFWIISPTPINLWSILFLYFILLLTLIISGFSFFASIVFVKLRDLQSVWEVLLSVLFYSAPIIYPITILPAHIQKIVMANPLAIIIEESKKVLLKGEAPDLYQVLYVTMFSLAIFIGGYLYFKRNIKKIAEFF